MKFGKRHIIVSASGSDGLRCSFISFILATMVAIIGLTARIGQDNHGWDTTALGLLVKVVRRLVLRREPSRRI